MDSATTRLLAISGPKIGGPTGASAFFEKWGERGREIATILQIRNGFYAYESALLIRPLHNERSPLGMLEWNVPELWKKGYYADLSGTLFFGEDVFGMQFCIRDGSISTFDPETGLLEVVGSSFEEWANKVLTEYSIVTGYPLAHEWQKVHGPLKPGERLLPKTPFFCGGKYELNNLYAIDDVKGMQLRATIANQIRDLPDGSQIIFNTHSKN